jgi:hypothetical protein
VIQLSKANNVDSSSAKVDLLFNSGARKFKLGNLFQLHFDVFLNTPVTTGNSNYTANIFVAATELCPHALLFDLRTHFTP